MREASDQQDDRLGVERAGRRFDTGQAPRGGLPRIGIALTSAYLAGASLTDFAVAGIRSMKHAHAQVVR